MVPPSDQWPEAGPSTLVLGNAPATTVRRRSSSAWKTARRYAIIVDAGSSGSRMQIYSWKDARVDKAQRERVGENVKVLPIVEKGTWEGSGRDWQIKVEPGLSSFGSHPQDLGEYLKPLFDHASSIIPSETLADTPVYVLATAGMRFLPDEQREAVIQETCQYIDRQTDFSLGVGGCSDRVQVITGEEEGLLGWIAINYLMDGFHFKSTSAMQGNVEGTKGRSTYGFLDMGGASTQIAFEPSGKSQTDEEETKDLTAVSLRMLDGTDVIHNVFVTTFLGFGTNKARERYLEALEAKSGALEPLVDPCLPGGLRMKAENGTTLMGTGSFDTCLSSLSPLLDKEATCNHPPCLFHGIHVPAIDFSVNHFIGVSEYWFSSNDVFKLGGVYDFVSFQKAAQEFCGRPWKELEAELQSGKVFGPQVSKDRLELQCFKSAWMTTVLHEGIGLPRIVDSAGAGDGEQHADSAQGKADEKNLFQSVNDVDGLAVSWTLGKAVLEATKEIAPVPVGGPQGAPVLGAPLGVPEDTSSWQDHFTPSRPRPSKALLDGNKHAVSGALVLAVVIFTALLTAVCCLFRGRSPKAIKRRTMVKDLVKAPCLKKRPRGDYVLASMEEGGHDMENLQGNGEGVEGWSSDASGDELGDPKESRHRHRRPSGKGLVATLLVPLQQLALAMGTKSAASSTASVPTNSRLAAKRKSQMPRLGLRRNMTSPATSNPVSPSTLPLMISNGIVSVGSAISRPASRASNSILSPRLNATTPTGASAPLTAGASVWTSSTTSAEASGGFFTHHQLPNSATASARSSRAASPVFGTSANSRANRNPNGPGYARKPREE